MQCSNATSHPCFRAPLPSVQAAFIALDGSAAFLTYFSAEIMLISGLFAWHKMLTQRKKKKQRKPKLIFLFPYLLFGHVLPQKTILDTLGGDCLLLQVRAALRAHRDILSHGWQGHRTNKEEKMAQLDHGEGHNSLQ